MLTLSKYTLPYCCKDTGHKLLMQGLVRGMHSGAHSAAGWKALAELEYQNRQWKAAFDYSCSALEWHAHRQAAGHETLTGFALSLRLCNARALRRLGHLDRAEEAFKTLAGTSQQAHIFNSTNFAVFSTITTSRVSRESFSKEAPTLSSHCLLLQSSREASQHCFLNYVQI